MTTIEGGCLCGAVRFRISGALHRTSHCHCGLCQKQHGAAFRTRARVAAKHFNFLQGEDLVTYYESSPGMYRGFCSRCGSPIVNRFGPEAKAVKKRPEALHQVGIALATLDGDPGVRAERHDFVASKAPWFEITDDVPQFATYEPPKPEGQT
ncbi:MAG: GFA family protein [Pseudomonadota bacterium]